MRAPPGDKHRRSTTSHHRPATATVPAHAPAPLPVPVRRRSSAPKAGQPWLRARRAESRCRRAAQKRRVRMRSSSRRKAPIHGIAASCTPRGGTTSRPQNVQSHNQRHGRSRRSPVRRRAVASSCASPDFGGPRLGRASTGTCRQKSRSLRPTSARKVLFGSARGSRRRASAAGPFSRRGCGGDGGSATPWGRQEEGMERSR
mmetsp:Transcript_29715/g.85197  ORF Transcript_29715/g.85197 Transcript_29715/m.85197 type:complete len:202 (-) Transcript_29715:2-607(-)